MAIDNCDKFCNIKGTPTLRTLIVSDTFNLTDKNDYKNLLAVIEMGKYIEISFTPSVDSNMTNFLNKNKASIIEFYVSDNFLYAKFKSSCSQIEPYNLSLCHYESEFEKPCRENSEVLVRDHILFNTYHMDINRINDYYFYFIAVSDQDSFLTQMTPELRYDYHTSLQNFLNYARILLFEWFKKDEWHNYNNLFLEYFPNFKNLYSEKFYKIKMDEHIQSLRTRINFILRSLQKIQFQFIIGRGNNGNFLMEYHFGYMIMLMTGAFDSLAWIINNKYNLNLKKEFIDLRKITKKISNPDLEKLLKNNYNSISLFYPIRDTLQHRIFVNANSLVIHSKFANNTDYNNYYISIKKDNLSNDFQYLENEFKNNSEKFGVLLENNDFYALQPMIFCERLFTIFVNIINNLIIEIQK